MCLTLVHAKFVGNLHKKSHVWFSGSLTSFMILSISLHDQNQYQAKNQGNQRAFSGIIYKVLANHLRHYHQNMAYITSLLAMRSFAMVIMNMTSCACRCEQGSVCVTRGPNAMKRQNARMLLQIAPDLPCCIRDHHWTLLDTSFRSRFQTPPSEIIW